REKRRGDRMAEAARAEMDADPDGACFVSEDVDVVVAAPDRAELLARLGDECLSMLRRHCAPCGVCEQWMIYRRVVRVLLATRAEAQGGGDRGGDLLEHRMRLLRPATEPAEGEMGSNRGIPARDAEPDAADGPLVGVRRAPADRHDVAHMAVGHEG